MIKKMFVFNKKNLNDLLDDEYEIYLQEIDYVLVLFYYSIDEEDQEKGNKVIRTFFNI